MIFISFDRAYATAYKVNSNLGRTFHRFRDMASFLLKNAHFVLPHAIQPPM